MKAYIIYLAIILCLVSCGKPAPKGERCRSADEAQMKCQVDYAENFRVIVIPDYIKTQCQSYYEYPGCYLDSSKRYNW